MKKYLLLILVPLLSACYKTECNCNDFKTGKFESEVTVNGVKQRTVSVRTDSLVIETYKGKTDTATIRWVSDCEYVLRQIHPKTMAEQKAISIKILTTDQNSYTFEFGLVGDDARQKGTARRLE
jgi:hypothetical protein